jgi:hypothetical protein
VTILRAVRAAAAASLLLIIAACARADASGGGRAEDNRDAGGYRPDALVLRVEYTGGFVTPSMLATRLPVVSVYADGRVITEGPQVLSYPPPALPNVQQQLIDKTDVDALVERAQAAGIGGPTVDYGEPAIADAANTRFTLITDEGTDVVEVYALTEDPGVSQGLTAAQVQARAKLRELVTALTDLAKTLGPDAVGPSEPYTPAALAAVSSPYAPDPSMPAQDPVAWPGPALPGQSIGPDIGCVTATGLEAEKALSAAEPATAITPWTSGGKRWMLGLRPLLPDESDCRDLID